MSAAAVAEGKAQPLAPWLTRQLQTLLGQRGHAVLLAGPAGLGQYELALALARAWLCEQPQPQGACGRCASCHAVDVRTHPELLVLMPEILALELGWPLDDKTRSRIEAKEIKPSKWIRVEAARAVVGFAQTTRSRGRLKVVLVHPADRLNVESANTLLKTLEEPAGEVRFVLATEAVHQLPATVRSRCQLHLLRAPEAHEAQQWLRACHPQASAEQAAVWLQAAGGRPQEALAWAARGLSPATWHGLPAKLLQGEPGPLADWEPAVALQVLQQLAHDCMRVAVGASPRFFDAADLPRPPAWPRLAAWAQELLHAARTVEHPFQPALMLEAWLARLHAALAARPAPRA